MTDCLQNGQGWVPGGSMGWQSYGSPRRVVFGLLEDPIREPGGTRRQSGLASDLHHDVADRENRPPNPLEQLNQPRPSQLDERCRVRGGTKWKATCL